MSWAWCDEKLHTVHRVINSPWPNILSGFTVLSQLCSGSARHVFHGARETFLGFLLAKLIKITNLRRQLYRNVFIFSYQDRKRCPQTPPTQGNSALLTLYDRFSEFRMGAVHIRAR